MVTIRENYCYKPWLLDFTLDALAEMDPYRSYWFPLPECEVPSGPIYYYGLA